MQRRTTMAAAWFAAWAAVSAAAAGEKPVCTVWPKGPPGEPPAEAAVVKQRMAGNTLERIVYVAEPTIELWRAPADKANGCCVVVCPGGGYNILAWAKEGLEVAEWLNSLGVTAVVLKYRVPRRDKEQPHRAPLQDVQRAIRLTRQHAADWGVDPNRVGVMGFSAGGHLTVMAGTHWDETTYPPVDEADQLSCRPDFLIPIYPAYLGDSEDPYRLDSLVRVTERTPPTFMAVTYDDKLRGAQAALLLVELKRAGVPAELHVFLKGGHGYGLRPSDNPVSQWPRLCGQWLQASGLLAPGR